MEKLRTDRIQNKPVVGYDRIIMSVLKAMSAADIEAKRGQAKVSAKVAEA